MSASDPWTRGRPLTEIGEFQLIERLRDRVGKPLNSAIELGIGDDAAVFRLGEDMDGVATCDIQIEGRHFRREWMTPEEAGARVANVNLSDIAAMGALPVAALVSLGVPSNVSVEAIEQVFSGLNRALAEHEASISGGNITGSSELILDVTVIGRVERGRALRRSTAQAGDVVFVTGCPGRAAAALRLLRDAGETGEKLGSVLGVSPADLKARIRRYHVAPVARISVGRHLLLNGLAHAAIDQSDGVAGDLTHLCVASRIGIVLEEEHLPADDEMRGLSELLGIDSLEWVLGPSDDYELLFTTPRDRSDDVFAMAAALDTPVSPIGWVESGEPKVRLRKGDGRLLPLPGGWDHLKTKRKEWA